MEIYFNFNEEGSAILFKELLAGGVINRLPEALANWLISSVQGLIIFADKVKTSYSYRFRIASFTVRAF